MKYAEVNQEAFEQIQKEAGMILRRFDVTGKTEIQDDDILFMTSGGINPVCEPQYEDFGSDIDNVMDDSMEFKQIVGYNCSFSFTAVNVSVETVRMELGCADVSDVPETAAGLTVKKITPRMEVKQTDFESDLWFVAPIVGGGFVACVLKNALSDSGFSIQTNKKGKGNVAVTIKGHPSIKKPDEVPMEYYVAKKSA